MKRHVYALFTATLISLNAYAAGNPGRSAMNCVDASYSDEKVIFRNTCSEHIFVVWCGDLKYNNKRCGDGPRGSYYTHSTNIDPGESRDAALKPGGSYQYAACIGRIGFGTDGIEAPAGNNGRFHCTPTGSNR